MPAPGTIKKYLSPLRIMGVGLYKSFVKQHKTEIEKDLFLEICETSCMVMRDFIIDDKEGLKLPYFGLLIPWRVKITPEIKERYAKFKPEKNLIYRTYFGKLAWVRYRVSRFMFSKAYSFVPVKELQQSIKNNANGKHPYKTCLGPTEIHDLGKVLLSLDDALAKKKK